MNPYGGPPKSTRQKINEGDARKVGRKKLERRLAAEPKASAGLGPCPRHLSGRAREVWQLWSEELDAMKLDRRPDAPALEAACVAYGRAVQADLILEAEGIVVYEKEWDKVNNEFVVVKVRKHPANEVSNRNWLTVRAFCIEFGFTPLSRTRLAPKDPPAGGAAEDDLLKALSQPRTPRPSMVQ